MRKLILTIATVAALIAVPVAANAQGFLSGLVVGGMLFGGNTQYGGAGATILYSANEETLKSVDPLGVRLVAYNQCFVDGNTAAHKSIAEMFTAVTSRRTDKKQTILQVARVFFPDAAHCAAVWFAYIEK